MLGIATIIGLMLASALVLWAAFAIGEGYESGDGGGE